MPTTTSPRKSGSAPSSARNGRALVPASASCTGRTPVNYFEAVQIGVEQDARIADDRDLHVARIDAAPLLGPGRGVIAQIAGFQPQRAHAPFP